MCICFFGCNANAQKSFFKHINTNNESYGSVIVETYTGELIVGIKEQDESSRVRKSKLVKLDEEGLILKEHRMKGYPNSMIDRIKPYDSLGKAFVVCGSIDTIVDNQCRRLLFVGIFDYDLNILQQVSFFCADEFQKGVVRDFELLSDGTCFILDRYGPNYVDRFRVWKINLNTGFVDVYNINDLNIRLGYGSMLSKNDSCLYITYTGLPIDSYQKSSDRMLILDYNLQYIDCLDLPSNLRLYVHSMSLPDDSYIVSGLGDFENYDRRGVNVCKMDYNHHMTNSYGIYSETSDTIIYSLSYNSLALLKDQFAVGSIYNIDIHGYPTQESPCWAMITLMNFDLSNVRHYYYGDGTNAYYGSDIISTIDGGLAVTGVYYDPQNINTQPDIFVLKLDADDILPTGNAEMGLSHSTEVMLWPNPGRELVNLKSIKQQGCFDFELYDISGNLVIRKLLTSKISSTVNTSLLPSC